MKRHKTNTTEKPEATTTAKRYGCKHCAESFDWPGQLGIHMRKVHPDLVKRPSQRSITAGGKTRDVQCPYCPARYTTTGPVFVRHIERRHPGEPLPAGVEPSVRRVTTRASNHHANGHALKFCPSCGCNLAAVQVALTL